MSLKFEDHIQLMFKWNLDSRVREKVKDTCLYKYVCNLHDIRLQSKHMMKLINSYDVTDKSFSISGKRIYLGLEDVLFITGLPIKGWPVTVDETPFKVEFDDYFGLDTNQGTTFKVNLLKQFECLSEIASDDSITKSTRAYLLYILGCVIFPSSWRKYELPFAFLHFVKNVEDVDKYAWGAVVLANTHNAIWCIKSKPTESSNTRNFLGGNGVLLSIFMMVHIPKIAEYFKLPRERFPTTFLLMKGWMDVMVAKDRDNHASIPIDDKIEYKPYTSVEVPEERKAEMKMFYVEMVPTFCLNRIHVYRGQHFACHLPDMDITSLWSPVASVKGKSRKNGRSINWPDVSRNSLEQWEMIQAHFYPVRDLNHEFLITQEEPTQYVQQEEEVIGSDREEEEVTDNDEEEEDVTRTAVPEKRKR